LRRKKGPALDREAERVSASFQKDRVPTSINLDEIHRDQVKLRAWLQDLPDEFEPDVERSNLTELLIGMKSEFCRSIDANLIFQIIEDEGHGVSGRQAALQRMRDELEEMTTTLDIELSRFNVTNESSRPNLNRFQSTTDRLGQDLNGVKERSK